MPSVDEVEEGVGGGRLAVPLLHLAQQQVALPGPALAGDDEILLAADELEAGKVHHEGLVEAGLKGPVEGLERLPLAESAQGDAALDSPLQLPASLLSEDSLKQGARSRPLARGPGEVLVEALKGVGQP